ncbi:hypothetical protein ACIQNU_02055 [Streptomyces sp. NPDC091292]|uniref:SCO2584 family spore wall biosynthesis protein n=1 Tax=Streptomyces sp. NPDC091292 TaxID=3365991 RepID=UPI003827E2DA
MPDDVGGTPFQDGREPDDDHDRGGADEEFASVVFDEEFVRSARVHEPTAVERLLAAAEARAEASEAEARRARARGAGRDDEGFGPDDGRPYGHDHGFDDDLYDPDLVEDRYARHGGGPLVHARWHRPLAWLLALVMGVGMVALAFAAVYRGASSGRQDQVPPPASTEVEQNAPGAPSAGPANGTTGTHGTTGSADSSRSPVPAVPRTP